MMQYQDDTDYYTVNYYLNIPRVSTNTNLRISASQILLLHISSTG